MTNAPNRWLISSRRTALERRLKRNMICASARRIPLMAARCPMVQLYRHAVYRLQSLIPSLGQFSNPAGTHSNSAGRCPNKRGQLLSYPNYFKRLSGRPSTSHVLVHKVRRARLETSCSGPQGSFRRLPVLAVILIAISPALGNHWAGKRRSAGGILPALPSSMT